MPVNWSLGLAPDIGGAFQQGYQQASRRNALSSYARDNNPQALNALAEFEPAFVMQEKQRMAQQQQAQQQQQENQLPMLGRLLEYGAQGPQQWQEAIGFAQKRGIDISQVPQEYNPEWAQQQAQMIKMVQSPEGQEVLSSAGKQAYDEGLRPGDGRFEARVTELVNAGLVKTIPYGPGGNVAAFDTRTGQTTPVVQGQSVEAPVPYDPNEWEYVEGGSGGNAGGGF